MVKWQSHFSILRAHRVQNTDYTVVECCQTTSNVITQSNVFRPCRILLHSHTALIVIKQSNIVKLRQMLLHSHTASIVITQSNVVKLRQM